MKSFVFLTVILCTSLSLFAQQPYSVRGTIPESFNGKKVFLVEENYHFNKLWIDIDSAIITNGTFELKGSTIDPVLLKLKFMTEAIGGWPIAVKSFFIAAGDSVQMKILGDESDEQLQLPTITRGSATHRDYNSYLTLMEPSESLLCLGDRMPAMAGLNNLLESKWDEGQQERLRTYQKEQDKLRMKFIETHPDSYVSLYVLSLQTKLRVTDIALAQRLYDTLSPALKNTALGKEVAYEIAQSALLLPGQIAPEFTAAGPDGKLLKLSDLRGKYVLLHFWIGNFIDDWFNTSSLLRAYKTYKDKGFDILSISLDDPGDNEKWKKAITEQGLKWHHVSEFKGWEGAISKQYLVNDLPASFLLDPSGKIVAVNVPEDIMGGVLKKLLENKSTNKSQHKQIQKTTK